VRAHDDRFESEVIRINLNINKPNPKSRILVGCVADGNGHGDGNLSSLKPSLLISMEAMQELQTAIYTLMVQKVGDKRYWVQWATDVADIAQRFSARIKHLIAEGGKPRKEFDNFLEGLKKNINPSIAENEAIEMLGQHLITKPVFEALFENYSFVQNNPVSKALQGIIDVLERSAPEKDTLTLSRFYESVKLRVKDITSLEARQKIIIELYDKFFSLAFKTTVERLGIVYTPVEVVDFIIWSVAAIIKKEFGRDISDKNVHILDPFTGTGTFITRLIQLGLFDKTSLPKKYSSELHANEIILLAYYIASINIENAYHEAMGGKIFKPFDGICLTDTFQLGESEDVDLLRSKTFPQNSERVVSQKTTPIRVIIGNPPYSVGQKSANDNAQNQSYPILDRKIAQTYATGSTATLKNSLYDSYIKAFRWASDRLDKEGGIIAFVTNAGWIDGNAMDGFRKCLEKEFSSIYVFNLRGNCRTSGELRQKEAGNIFGLGSRAPIALTLLIKKPEHKGKAVIRYCEVDDYLTREQKLDLIAKRHDVLNPEMRWEIVKPNEHGDWLNQRSDAFENYIPVGDKDNKNNNKTIFLSWYSRGLATSRDSWCYNFSKSKLVKNIKNSIDFYNGQVDKLETAKIKNKGKKINPMEIVDLDSTLFSWDRQQKFDVDNQKKYSFFKSSIVTSIYRPFHKQICYFNSSLNNCIYQLPKLFPSAEHKNLVICVSGVGVTKEFSTIITDFLPDLELIGKSQCFPLYYYSENDEPKERLFDTSSSSGRHDGITDFILKQCHEKYGKKPSLSKEDIFYYVYGILHSQDYRETFSADLKKMLPRLPLVDKIDDFWAFSKAGRSLAKLHLNYEDYKKPPDVKVVGVDSNNFIVDKMRFVKKEDKSVIQYNSKIKITNIPLEAYEYVVNGRSAIDWIMERYQVKTDSESQIKNDPNDWAKEHDQPRYILDLLLSIITVSLETMKIVKTLPKLKF
jgi:predicted helicase